MTKLEDLYYSLTTVLVRYHDSQAGVTKLINESDPHLLRKKSRSCAIAILQNKDVHYKIRMDELIKECTKGYPGRTPFLYFLLHQITFLKALQDRNKSFEPIQLEEYINQLTQFLIDLRKLLNTTKSKTYVVKYSRLSIENEPNAEVTIALSGLINDYYPYSLCNSGFLLKEEVLETLNIALNYSDSEIKVIAESLCIEHQNALLVPELQAKLMESKELNTKQQEEIISTTSQYRKLQEKSESQEVTIKERDETISALKTRVSDLSRSGFPNQLAAAYSPAFFGLSRYGSSRTTYFPSSSAAPEQESNRL